MCSEVLITNTESLRGLKGEKDLHWLMVLRDGFMDGFLACDYKSMVRQATVQGECRKAELHIVWCMEERRGGFVSRVPFLGPLTCAFTQELIYSRGQMMVQCPHKGSTWLGWGPRLQYMIL